MWIVMNDSFISVVEHNTDEDRVVVRARIEGDLDKIFPEHKQDIIVTTNSDYRFRLLLDKQYVADRIYQRMLDIDYDNFKDSVAESWRKAPYYKIWQIMQEVQEKLYKNRPWWENYR